MRDIQVFLDHDEERATQGFLLAVERTIEQLSATQGKASGSLALLKIVNEVDLELSEWLGITERLNDTPGLAPPRFQHTDGLWRYSPLLCGVGLEEELEMVAPLGRVLWDGMPELLLVIHVYNMLVQRTYLEPIELFQKILDVYPAAFFVDGEVPKADFLAALLKRVEGESVHNVRRKLRPDFELPEDPLRGQTV